MKKAFLIFLSAGLLAISACGQPSTREADRDTLSYTAKDGTRYRMIVVGDKLPELYVNDKKVKREDLELYDEIIGLLQERLVERQRKSKPSKPSL